MRSRAIAITLVAAVALTMGAANISPASAQTASTVGTVLPVVLWAATGTVIGAVAWPMIVGGGAAAAAAPGVMTAGSLLNTGAAVGTVLGGVGYLLTR
jgi:hypothetical protein